MCELNLSSTDKKNGTQHTRLPGPEEFRKIRQPGYTRVLRHYFDIFTGLIARKERGMAVFIFTPRSVDDNKSACDFACPQLFVGIYTSGNTTPEKAITKAEKRPTKLMMASGCITCLKRATRFE